MTIKLKMAEDCSPKNLIISNPFYPQLIPCITRYLGSRQKLHSPADSSADCNGPSFRRKNYHNALINLTTKGTTKVAKLDSRSSLSGNFLFAARESASGVISALGNSRPLARLQLTDVTRVGCVR